MLICVSCYVMFLNIALELRNRFYKLVALGLGTCYIFQVFLTIGGVTKFIPSTGVTLPLVSYGGSSILSTMIMIGIIQGLYIVREDEEEMIQHKREMAARAAERRRAKEEREAGRRFRAGRAETDLRNQGSDGPVRNKGRQERRRGGSGPGRGRAEQGEQRRERALNNERGSTDKKRTKQKSKFEEVPKQRIR